MPYNIQPIREWSQVTRDQFEQEIRPLREPAVFRGLVPDWPLVRKGQQSSSAAVEYLKRLYSKKQIGTIKAGPEAEGRLFYNEQVTGYNFQRIMQDMRVVLQELLDTEHDHSPPTIAMQAITASDHLRGFDDDHPMPLLDRAPPRLWIGNSAVIAPHYDLLDNIACVAVGRRRFTLFPPDQLANLYVGPIDNTPAGAPISMVDVNDPDFETYPRFAEALAHAQVAELEAGDAIFIPYMWWHGVEALERFNVLVNYWWDEHSSPELVPPRVAMMIARLAFKDMSEEQLGRWRTMFDRYIFNPADDAMEHLPDHAKGLFGKMSGADVKKMRQVLGRMLLDD
ncbi:MAG: cupin-like domain-containing protein [Sphingomicrobium sp.]